MRIYYVLSVPGYEGFTADIFRSTILSGCRQTIILTEEEFSNSDSTAASQSKNLQVLG